MATLSRTDYFYSIFGTVFVLLKPWFQSVGACRSMFTQKNYGFKVQIIHFKTTFNQTIFFIKSSIFNDFNKFVSLWIPFLLNKFENYLLSKLMSDILLGTKYHFYVWNTQRGMTFNALLVWPRSITKTDIITIELVIQKYDKIWDYKFSSYFYVIVDFFFWYNVLLLIFNSIITIRFIFNCWARQNKSIGLVYHL